MSEPLIDGDTFLRLVLDTIPMARGFGLRVESLGWGFAHVRLAGGDELVRAGGTIGGPAIMALGDVALYAAVLTQIGVEPMAVTSDLAFRFLAKPDPIALHAEASILRRGRRQSVGEVRFWSEGDRDRLIAHATGTYALPKDC